MVDIRLEVDYTCVHIIRIQYKESNSVEILSDCCKSVGPGDKSLMHFCSFLDYVFTEFHMFLLRFLNSYPLEIKFFFRVVGNLGDHFFFPHF